MTDCEPYEECPDGCCGGPNDPYPELCPADCQLSCTPGTECILCPEDCQDECPQCDECVKCPEVFVDDCPTTCEMCCTLDEGTAASCVEAHYEWIPEDPGSWGVQDIFTFDVDILWVEGNVQTGLSVLPKDTQDIEATEHQSWNGAFTFSKSYVVIDNDPVPEEGPEALPVPITPVP